MGEGEALQSSEEECLTPFDPTFPKLYNLQNLSIPAEHTLGNALVHAEE